MSVVLDEYLKVWLIPRFEFHTAIGLKINLQISIFVFKFNSDFNIGRSLRSLTLAAYFCIFKCGFQVRCLSNVNPKYSIPSHTGTILLLISILEQWFLFKANVICADLFSFIFVFHLFDQDSIFKVYFRIKNIFHSLYIYSTNGN